VCCTCSFSPQNTHTTPPSRSHQQIPENGADVAHLNVLHREFIVAALYPFLSHKWRASWTKGKEEEDRKPFADITVQEQICVLDHPVPGEVSVKISQCGPSQVYLEMDTPVGQLVIVETVTPTAPQQLRVLHAVYAAPMVPRVVAKAILLATLIQFRKDVPVWCNKRYLPSGSGGGAQLVKVDEYIIKYRQWVRQFWSKEEGSITFEQAVKQHLSDTLGLPQDSSLEW
jgi:hypothetical protein